MISEGNKRETSYKSAAEKKLTPGNGAEQTATVRNLGHMQNE